MKVIIGTLVGFFIGVAGTYVFFTAFKEHLDDLAVMTKYQIVNSYVLNNGDYKAVKSQHKAWLDFLSTYKPNSYSLVATYDALNMEKSVAHYRLAANEKKHNNLAAYEDHLSQAIKFCAAFSDKDENCSISMLNTMSCVFNITGKNLDCSLDKTLDSGR
jgi:hypothetical protein